VSEAVLRSARPSRHRWLGRHGSAARAIFTRGCLCGVTADSIEELTNTSGTYGGDDVSSVTDASADY
jgi:hypothetical protein